MRLFTEHKKRNVQLLDGAWKFIVDSENKGLKEAWYERMPENTERTVVPSVWNTRKGLLEYEGAAWYSRSFYTEGGTLRFVFEAVMTEAKVWLDGEELGSHYGGFSCFDFIVSSVEAGEHTLTVLVDNSFDAHSIPQAMVDWYHYGGIIRSVSVENLKGICVLGNKVHYQINDSLDAASLHYELDLYNADQVEKSDCISASLKEQWDIDCAKPIAEMTTKVLLAPGERRKIVTETQELQNIKLWDTESPKLYSIEFATDTDDLLDRVGFREVHMKDHAIWLNGKQIEMRGVNRHEEHPDFGFALPAVLMEKDLDIITDMGCNAIRGSHYPNSKLFLDMLDEKGILFWSEIPIWGVGFEPETLADPLVLERGLFMHEEMLRDYYNHPSIIFWGMHNEIRVDTPEGYEMSRRYYQYLKENGGNRIVTYATARPLTDICLEFCDVISINSYVGWYEGTLEEWSDLLDAFRTRRKELGLEDKPVIMSEFGAAAVYGHKTFDDNRWSENYQAKLLAYCLELFHKDPMIIGTFIWQFTDIRTAKELGLNRARGFNNKGIVNEYRNPKSAFYEVRRLYREYNF